MSFKPFLNLNAFWRIIATVGLTSNFLGTSCSKSIHFGIHATSRRCQHELTLTSITDDMCFGQKIDCSVHWVLTTFHIAGKEMIPSDCPQVSIKQKCFHGDQLSVLQTCQQMCKHAQFVKEHATESCDLNGELQNHTHINGAVFSIQKKDWFQNSLTTFVSNCTAFCQNLSNARTKLEVDSELPAVESCVTRLCSASFRQLPTSFLQLIFRTREDISKVAAIMQFFKID